MLNQAEKAEYLRALHRGPDILVLPNAWDCASARIFECAGFSAIGTTSAGIAFSLGYPDGQKISMTEMLDAVRRIARCVEVPVTADMEAGYDDVAESTAQLIDCGAIGLNLEDVVTGKLVDLEEQVDKIRTIRRVSDSLGVKLVINARTDLYLENIGDAASRFDAACHRLKAFIRAGADCLFIPGIQDAELIRNFVNAMNFPINILAWPETPSIPELRRLGVARVSVGPGIVKAAMETTRQLALEIKNEASFATIFQRVFSYAEANQMFERKR